MAYVLRRKQDYTEVDLQVFLKSKTIECYWNNAHKSAYSYWTSSGNSFIEIANSLKIPKNLNGKKILVIGPGVEVQNCMAQEF